MFSVDSNLEFYVLKIGALAAQQVKRLPTDLAVPGLSSAQGRNIFNSEQGSIAYSLSVSSLHPPDMTEILLKRT